MAAAPLPWCIGRGVHRPSASRARHTSRASRATCRARGDSGSAAIARTRESHACSYSVAHAGDPAGDALVRCFLISTNFCGRACAPSPAPRCPAARSAAPVNGTRRVPCDRAAWLPSRGAGGGKRSNTSVNVVGYGPFHSRSGRSSLKGARPWRLDGTLASPIPNAHYGVHRIDDVRLAQHILAAAALAECLRPRHARDGSGCLDASPSCAGVPCCSPRATRRSPASEAPTYRSHARRCWLRALTSPPQAAGRPWPGKHTGGSIHLSYKGSRWRCSWRTPGGWCRRTCSSRRCGAWSRAPKTTTWGHTVSFLRKKMKFTGIDGAHRGVTGSWPIRKARRPF